MPNDLYFKSVLYIQYCTAVTHISYFITINPNPRTLDSKIQLFSKNFMTICLEFNMKFKITSFSLRKWRKQNGRCIGFKKPTVFGLKSPQIPAGSVGWHDPWIRVKGNLYVSILVYKNIP